MDFGIGIATAADSWKLARWAEELGFTHAWFYDTQMITADPFIAMGVAATKTSRIRLGTGVLVPSTASPHRRRTALPRSTSWRRGGSTSVWAPVLGAAGDGARRDEARRHGGVHPGGLRAA